jgi:hypothetical protein
MQTDMRGQHEVKIVVDTSAIIAVIANEPEKTALIELTRDAELIAPHKEGGVKIRRKDGQVFVIRPKPRKDSPLDVEGISLDISVDEVVQIIREGREAKT